MIKMKHPVLTLGIWYWMLAHDSLGIVRISFLAAILHECGHILAWILYKKSLPELSVSFYGISMHMKQLDCTVEQELLLALAGPCFNLLFAGLGWLLLLHKASYWCWFFTVTNILMAGFNLLPVFQLDGKRIFACIKIILERQRTNPKDVCNF